MAYKILEHTADLRMRVSGKTLKELFDYAVFGMLSFMNGKIKSDEESEVKRTIKTTAGDKTALLINFLNDVLTSAQTSKETYTAIVFHKFFETELEAELAGVPVDKFKEDIKAVTFHEADIKQNYKGEWETKLVFDI